MNRDHHVLWCRPRTGRESGATCVMVSCCEGAELQLLRSTASGEEEIVLRELYPDRDSLYQRARELRAELDQAAASEAATGSGDLNAEP